MCNQLLLQFSVLIVCLKGALGMYTALLQTQFSSFYYFYEGKQLL